MSTVDPESSTQGAGLRQSHFGSGYDAGKARLQAEVEELKGQLAAMEAVVERVNGAVIDMRADVAADIARETYHRITVQRWLKNLDAALNPRLENGTPWWMP